MKKPKIKNIGGRLAANFRKANIAEGFAAQMFRPFSAIAPISREEDFGIDLVGTLIRKEGKVMVAEDSFAVQVKIATAPEFTFAGKGINWLKELKIPYFPVVVDLSNAKISIYSLNQYHMPLFTSRLSTFNFVVQNEHCEGDKNEDFPLRDPIMEWGLMDCIHPDFPSWAYSTLKPFIQIEASNFRYGNLMRFKIFNTETIIFDPVNSKKLNRELQTTIFDLPYPDEDVLRPALNNVIGPFINWATNQKNLPANGEPLVNLRNSLRQLGFDPDPNDEWDELINDLNGPRK